LGWMGWLPAVLGLLTGFVLGGVGALLLILFRRADRRSHMSFGPAMVVGAYVWCVLAGVI
jgi:leader peptidase (prepilin peptidase)/N-methyltransferase